MAPDAENVGDAGYRAVPVHGGAPRRVAPARPAPLAPARAWLEREGPPSPGEHRRLLDAADPPSPKLQAGLTLGVWDAAKKHTKCPDTPKSEKAKAKTKFQKRSKKLYSVLKPPYFILTVIILMVSEYILNPSHLQRSFRSNRNHLASIRMTSGESDEILVFSRYLFN